MTNIHFVWHVIRFSLTSIDIQYYPELSLLYGSQMHTIFKWHYTPQSKANDLRKYIFSTSIVSTSHQYHNQHRQFHFSLWCVDMDPSKIMYIIIGEKILSRLHTLHIPLGFFECYHCFCAERLCSLLWKRRKDEKTLFYLIYYNIPRCSN